MQSLYGAIANYKQKEIMAISVDKVYQKVLALANKEQRGYITPQEFNLFADQAQMDIFEQYFYDLNQTQRTQGTEMDYADLTTNIEEKVSIFEKNDQSMTVAGSSGNFNIGAISDFYRLGTISILYANDGGLNFYTDVEPIRLSELRKYEKSLLAKPTKNTPVYSKFSSDSQPLIFRIYPYPTGGDDVLINYIRKPKSPKWTYVISHNKNALYNPSAIGHQDFELHSSEESTLVFKILQLAGLSIKDYQLSGAASQQEMKTLQQEKQ